MMGESDTTGRSPSDQVLLPPCSFAAPTTKPAAPAGFAVRICICTLPSAPVSGFKVPLATNSQPSTKSAGKRTSITDGACTHKLVPLTLPPFGCLPNNAGSTPHRVGADVKRL